MLRTASVDYMQHRIFYDMIDHELLDVLKTLGYSNDQIKTILSAAESAELESVRATRDLTQLPTPIEAAAQSARHAAQLRVLDGLIFSASGCKYRLPKDRPVDINEVNAAIRNASVDARMRVKSALRALNLIAP